MAESKIEEGGSNGRPLREFAVAVTLLFQRTFLLIAKLLSPGLARGGGGVITLCPRPGHSVFHSALSGTRDYGTRCTFCGHIPSPAPW